MSKITFGDHSFVCNEEENLLDAFFRNKVDIPFSCRNGTCQACLIQAVSGPVTTDSQIGLSQHLIDTKHFLPCKCYPISDMELKSPCIKDIYSSATIIALEELSDNIKLVTIKPNNNLAQYKTGQFINIRTNLDNKVRSYSIANHYQTDGSITIHVQKIAGGIFSSWIFDRAKNADEIQIHYPLGACFSSGNSNKAGKLLIATGSGLGAIFAIANEALESGFTNPLHLCHSSKIDSGLYLQEELRALESKYTNFKYSAFVSEKKSGQKDVGFGYIDELVFKQYDSLKDWEVYIYGNPVMVKSAILKSLTLGCEQEKIYCDAFEYGENAQYNQSAEETDKMEFIEEEKRKFIPDPKMWQALGEGKRLNEILNDFYDKVLVDPLLAPFFKGVTKGHIVGKQYAFLNQIFTGKDCYFGDRPRNAHHWMIISDSLFDHREKLFADSCIKCGLKEPFLSQLLDFDESYRATMVKTKVWPRITDGEIKPIKGFEEMTLDIGSICDGCQKELEPGDHVHYHDRTGEMFCEDCRK